MSRNQTLKDSMTHSRDSNNEEIRCWCIKSSTDEHALSNEHYQICAENIHVKVWGHDSLVRHSKEQSQIESTQQYRDENENLKQPRPTQTGIVESFSRGSSSKSTVLFPDHVTASEAIWCTVLAVVHFPAHACDKIVPTLSCFQTRRSLLQWHAGEVKWITCSLMDLDLISEMVENEIRNSAEHTLQRFMRRQLLNTGGRWK